MSMIASGFIFSSIYKKNSFNFDRKVFIKRNGSQKQKTKRLSQKGSLFFLDITKENGDIPASVPSSD